MICTVKMDRRLVLASGQRRRPLGLMMAWLALDNCTTKDEHSGMNTLMGGEHYLEARQVGRAALQDIAGRNTPDGEKARELLAMEQEDGGDVAEPRCISAT